MTPVVTPVPHPVKGFVPAAMVITREGSAITAGELKTYCLAKGPAYSHPRFIAIVGALPLNGAGKIDRAAVQAQLAALSPRPGGERSDFTRSGKSG